MTKDKAFSILTQTGAALEGHFLLTSGRHSNRYMQCARLFESPASAGEMCADLAVQLKDMRVDIVVGPALGGIIMAFELARQLGVKNVFAEREEGLMTLRRGFTIEKGARCVISEDAVTTGGSVREVMEVVRKAGGEVVAVAAVVDRSAGKVDFGVPFVSVLSVDVESWPADACPLCAEGSKPVKPGSRRV